MCALRIDEQTCLSIARWYQGWAIIDQVVPNIRSCQISDQQNDNSFQIVEGIFPSLFLWTTVVSEDISNVAWNRWTFHLWIQKHICYELWISIMGPMAFRNILIEKNGLSLLLRDENLWEMQGKEPGSLHWLTVMGGLERNGQILTVGSNFLARDQT